MSALTPESEQVVGKTAQAGNMLLTAKINVISTLTDDSAKSSSIHKVKKRIVHTAFAAVMVATGGLTLGTSTPANARPLKEPPNVRRFNSDLCSKSPNKIPGIFDFRQACYNHDACIEYEIRRGHYGSWTSCDNRFKANMHRQCRAQWEKFDPRRFACHEAANRYFLAVRAAFWRK